MFKRSMLLLLCLLLLAALPVFAQQDEDDNGEGGAADTVVIQPFEVGVLFNTLDGTLSDPLPPGTHTIIPGVQMLTLYSTAQQTYGPDDSDTITARTIDGQEVQVFPLVVYSLSIDTVNLVHTRWQQRYDTDYVRPVLRALVRDAVARFEAQSLVAEGRRALADEIEASITAAFQGEGLTVHDVLIRDILFTQEYQAALAARAEAEVAAQRAAIDAERRVIEAQGQADAALIAAEAAVQARIIEAQGEAEALSIISDVLAQNPLLIQYLLIQSLSDNVSVVLVPTGDGLSLALDDFLRPPPAMQPPVDPAEGP